MVEGMTYMIQLCAYSAWSIFSSEFSIVKYISTIWEKVESIHVLTSIFAIYYDDGVGSNNVKLIVTNI